MDGESAADLGKASSSSPLPSGERSAAQQPGEGDQTSKPETPSPQPSPPRGEGALTAVAAPVEPDPEVPPGTEMVKLTVREALRDAMAAEMRRDGDCS